MAEKLGEALLDLDTNDKGLKRGIDRAAKDATGLGKVLDSVGQKAVQLGKALALGAAVSFGVGITSAVKRLEEMRKVSAQVDQAIANSGNTARTSAKEIERWASALENRTGRATADVMALSANLASFGFGRTEFFRSIELANDMAAAWGGDLRQNLEGLARALDDPLTGMAMLSKRGIKLTDEQKKLAEAFLKAGDQAAAQGVVFEALEAQVKGVAEKGFSGLTKTYMLAIKVWNEAFDALVRGDGDAADLRATLEELIKTMSSPEFVSAAMGMGNAIVNALQFALDAIMVVSARLKDLRVAVTWASNHDMFGNPIERRPGGKEFQKFNTPEEAKQLLADALKNGKTDGPDASFYDGIFAPAEPRVVLDRASGSGAGRGDKSKAETDKINALIASLKAERDMMREMDPVQQRLISMRDQLSKATGTQRDEVEGLIKTIYEETRAWEASQAAGQFFGDQLLNSIEAVRTGSKSLIEVLDDVINSLAQAVLQSMLLGQGPLSGLFGTQGAGGGLGGMVGGLLSKFAGGFATGGLMPAGSFGIVGEQGPELISSTSRGALITSNSDLANMMGGGGRGPVSITVQGSGLTQSEMTQAISDALESYDRHQLPQRVTDIQNDPLARG